MVVGGQIMKSKQITEVSPYLLDGHLILSLDQKYIEVCKGIPSFKVVIDEENRLHLIGPAMSKDKLKESGD